MRWQPDVADPSHRHGVQFFKPDERFLDERVGDFLAEGLRDGSSIVIATTPERHGRFLRRLATYDVDVAGAAAAGRLVFLEASATVAAIFAQADVGAAFDRLVGRALDQARLASRNGLVRAYGDMVGALWLEGRIEDLVLLERAWNDAIKRGGLDLLCGYPIDVLSPDFHLGGVGDIFCEHSHVLPTRSGSALEDALDRSIDDALGSRADAVRKLVRANLDPRLPKLPRAEATIVWLRQNLTDQAQVIIDNAQRYCLPGAFGEGDTAADTASSNVV